MASKSIEEVLRQFERALAQSEFQPDAKRKTPNRLRHSVGVFCVLSTNRDGRGVRHSVKQRVVRTVDRVRHAVRHASEHEDANIRTAAKACVRSAQVLAFEELEEAATGFVGLLRKVGHRRKERQRRAGRFSARVNDLDVTDWFPSTSSDLPDES